MGKVPSSQDKTRLLPQARFAYRARIRILTAAALGAALLCLLSPISLPLGTIPLSLGLFALCLVALLLPLRLSLPAVVVYLFLGALGLPVFAGLGAGMGVLLGPTGGYLLAYIPAVLCMGLCARHARYAVHIVGAILSWVICCLGGMFYYMILTNTAPGAALTVCILPFIVPDMLKLTAALFLANLLKHRISRSKET